MAGIPTQLFRFTSQAPADEVWAALTSPELTARYLYGLAVTSAWHVGAPVALAGAGSTVSGEVLAAEEPRRLSYSLRAGDGQPETYVTWEILGEDGGTVVRLYVDEPGEPLTAEVAEDTESTWLKVVSRLQAVLARTRPYRPTP